ncbi:CPBP family intramembrane glutamic endopeptidase [Homoserinibacter sp. GY 40078]|uniref:CPBP family intramembrane glutamic endopeptidase n=1 Tax=Homoserinibacter sp. GY 40078 TaxID=2603275 RepID=UPI00164F56F0|nr:CPBP family intramembrane glutamic endopeptidase [Homoserinibacter sp. GY 40078]
MDSRLLALLLVVVAFLVWRAVTRERREYARFRRLRATGARQKVMRRWLAESVLVMGGLSAAILLAAGDYVPAALADAQVPFAGIRDFLGTAAGTVVAIVVGVAAVALLVVPVLLLGGTSLDDVPKVGDIGALLPRTRGELPYGTGLAVSAGVFEELMFRLALPALLFGLLGDGLLSFLLATLLFGALHLYQKAVGMIVATVLGAIFALLYIVSGTILLPIVVHVLVDLRSLVLLPLVLGRVWAIDGRPGSPAAGSATIRPRDP